MAMKRKWAMAVVGVLAAVGSSEAGVRVGVRVGPRVAVAHRVVVRAPVLRVWTAPTVVVTRGYGELQVEVEPDRARVFIDGKGQGKGDTRETLRAGTHRVKVMLADGREASQTVQIRGGQRTIAKLDLD
jgi:hypothetical protein